MLRSCADLMAGSGTEVSPVVPHAIQAATALQDPVTRGLTIYGDPLPPLPMTRKEARALGLKTYPGQALCRKDGTNVRRTRDGQCVACLERAKAEQEAREQAIREEERARVLKSARAQVLRQLAAEERQRQREEERARKEAEKAAEEAARQEREKERRQQKAAETRARNKADKEGAREAPAVDALPPWEGASSAAATAAMPAEAPAVVEGPSAAAPPWAEFGECIAGDDEDDLAPW